MCGHVQTLNLLALKFNVRINHVIGEYIAAGQELPVCISALRAISRLKQPWEWLQLSGGRS